LSRCRRQGAHFKDLRAPAGDIHIHGGPNGWRKWFVRHPTKDWTTGCVAVADVEMREIRALVPTGVRMVIHP
jgi:murein L,D-transpeptidase YafK